MADPDPELRGWGRGVAGVFAPPAFLPSAVFLTQIQNKGRSPGPPGPPLDPTLYY